jgi:two-component system, OmpR family, heavy metal sensor histidine kinase CusS
MTLKFKNRIALFNTLAVAITTAMVFVAIYFVVDKTAYKHLDADIYTEKEEVNSSLFWKNDSIIINKMPEWDEAEHANVEVSPTFLQIVDSKGRIIFHSANLLKDKFPYNPENKQDFFFNGEINGQRIRLGQFPVLNDSGQIIGQLTIAVSQEESFIILDNLIWVLLISFPLMLLVHFIASSLAASKAIKPVHRLIQTTSGISQSNLGTRLDLPEHKDELFDLTNTINELLARIEASLKQQKQFTSDASHEIRTPLSAIRGTLEVLIRKQREPKLYEEKISGVIGQVDRLDALLDQLLQLARLESGTNYVRKETINLSQVLLELKERWAEASTLCEISIHLQITNQAIVTGDKLFLELMLDNLVSNAIKYGKENGNVFISWDETAKTLSVKDDGQGIPEADLPHIFDRFYRVDESRSSEVKGNGLGLSIVKEMAGIQQIILTVDSQPGTGSTFRLKFPY